MFGLQSIPAIFTAAAEDVTDRSFARKTPIQDGCQGWGAGDSRLARPLE